MTEQQNTETTPEEATLTTGHTIPENATPEPPEAEAEPTGNKAAREAAKYRRQLRDTETQLEAAQTLLTQAREQILRTALTGHKIAGNTFNVDALTDAGLDTATLFGDDGQLQQDALDQAMQNLATEKPYMFTPPQKLFIPNEGRAPGDTSFGRDTWRGAFAPEA